MLKQLWRRWQAFGHWIGDFVARVLLTLFYFTIFAVFAVAMSRFHDPLGTKTAASRFWHLCSPQGNTLPSMRRQA